MPTKRKPKFECPECGAILHSPQGLGKHRRSFHAVVGSSPASVHRHRHGEYSSRAKKPVCILCMDKLMRQREKAKNKRKRFDLGRHIAKCGCSCHAGRGV